MTTGQEVAYRVSRRLTIHERRLIAIFLKCGVSPKVANDVYMRLENAFISRGAVGYHTFDVNSELLLFLKRTVNRVIGLHTHMDRLLATVVGRKR